MASEVSRHRPSNGLPSVTLTEICCTFLLFRSKPNSHTSFPEQKLRITFLVHSAQKCDSNYHIRTLRSEKIAAKYFRRRVRESLYYQNGCRGT
jgi:hypothetical protein